jgi:hypothetical protein
MLVAKQLKVCAGALASFSRGDHDLARCTV